MSNETEIMNESLMEQQRVLYEDRVKDPAIKKSEILSMISELKKIARSPAKESAYKMSKIKHLLISLEM